MRGRLSRHHLSHSSGVKLIIVSKPDERSSASRTVRKASTMIQLPKAGIALMVRDVLAFIGLCVIIAKGQKLYAKLTA